MNVNKNTYAPIFRPKIVRSGWSFRVDSEVKIEKNLHWLLSVHARLEISNGQRGMFNT